MLRTTIAAVLAFAPATTLACEPLPTFDPRPWAERVAGADPLFIGKVVEIRGETGRVWDKEPVCPVLDATPECAAFHYGFNIVVFAIEVPITGKLGERFEVEQGRGTDCRLEFYLGQRWIFAGNSIDSPSMFINDTLRGLN